MSYRVIPVLASSTLLERLVDVFASIFQPCFTISGEERVSPRFLFISFSRTVSWPTVKPDVYGNDQTPPQVKFAAGVYLSSRSAYSSQEPRSNWKFAMYYYSLLNEGLISFVGWRARALVAAAWGLSVLFSVPIIFLYEEKRIQV